jgi:tetratricopeptide (TPR) repeat protein
LPCLPIMFGAYLFAPFLPLKGRSLDYAHPSFKFNKRTKKYLTGKLEQLPKLNALELYHNYFNEAMARLRERYLKQPVYGEIIPIPISDLDVVARAIAQITTEPKPTNKQLSAEEYFNRALEKQEAKDYDGAITDYNNAIELNPKLSEAYNNRGTAHADKGNLDGAITDYNNAIELNPKFGEAYNNRGTTHADKGNLDGAITDYNNAIELNPMYAKAYYNRGITFYLKNNFDAAFADFDKAIELNPKLGEAYNNRGVVYLTLKNFTAARSDFNKTLKLNFDNSRVQANIAIADHALGNVDKALRIWKRLLKKEARYRDPEWVRKEQKWADPLVEEAKKLISRL